MVRRRRGGPRPGAPRRGPSGAVGGRDARTRPARRARAHRRGNDGRRARASDEMRLRWTSDAGVSVGRAGSSRIRECPHTRGCSTIGRASIGRGLGRVWWPQENARTGRLRSRSAGDAGALRHELVLRHPRAPRVVAEERQDPLPGASRARVDARRSDARGENIHPAVRSADLGG